MKILTKLSTGFHNLPFVNKLDTHMLEVLHGAGTAFFLKIVGASLAFGFNICLGRLLGAEGAGVYFLALACATFAGVIGRMGLGTAALRFTAANASVDNWIAVKGIFRHSIILTIAGSIMSSVALFFIAPVLSEYIFHDPNLLGPIRLVTLIVAPFSLMMLYANLLRGLKKISGGIFVMNVGLPLFSFAAIWYFVKHMAVVGAIIAYGTGAIVTLAIGAGLWKRYNTHAITLKGKFDIKILLRSCLPLLGMNFLNVLMNWAPVLILGIWVTKTEVGIYSIAQRTAFLTSLILLAVNSIAAPKFAALFQQGKLADLDRTARNTTKLTLLMACPLLFIFLSMPVTVMQIFGSDFSTGAVALSILAVGQFINVATGSVSVLLMMCGYERFMPMIMSISVAVNIVLNILLIPRFGIIGASVGTALSFSLQNIIAFFLVWRVLGIWTLPFKQSAFHKSA